MSVTENCENVLNEITRYVGVSSGLDFEEMPAGNVKIKQKIDGKNLVIDSNRVEKVLAREDGTGKSFIQINFYSGLKLLLTERLIGFKPVSLSTTTPPESIPKVVTTPDLFSVFEAIQEAMSEDAGETDVTTLKKVFESVIQGGEAIGFDLSKEKSWLQRLTFGAPTAISA